MPTPESFLSAREATDLLASTGLPRTSVRRALTAGVAGQPQRLRGSLLYERSLVEALIREPLTEADLPPPLNAGTLVLRLWFGRADEVRFRPEQGAEHTRASVAAGWQMSWVTRAMLALRAEAGIPMPVLATCGGFVVVGAYVTGAAAAGTGSTTLRLAPPGPWYDNLHLRILRTPRGRPWTLLPHRRLHAQIPWRGIDVDPRSGTTA